MKESKLVVRYLDGHVIKGHTLDFSSTKDSFHVVPLDGGASIEVRLPQIKAVFATNDQKTGMRSFVDNGPGKATFEGI